MNKSYEDIINLPHHTSSTRLRMSVLNRAAQFSPFAALTGYDSAIKEAARLTDERIELGESTIADLDMKLTILADMISEFPKVSVTYFLSDSKKKDGAYVDVEGAVKRIDDYEKSLIFVNGKKIPIADILDIQCDLFESLTL